jgi:transcriptional regulator with XRE-family HTH domain
MPHYAPLFRLPQHDSPEYCVCVTSDGWQGRLTAMIAREIRRHRDRRKLSAQQLADLTAEFGMPIPRNVLANLESGRRDTITVAEVLVLAAVLGVSPMELICPAGYDDEIELLPARKMDPLQASRWIDGELVLDVTGPTADFRPPAAGERSGIALLEHHAALLDEFGGHEAAVIRGERDLDAARANYTMIGAAADDAAGHDKDLEAAMKLHKEGKELQQAVRAAAAELDYRVRAAEMYKPVVEQGLRFTRAEMRRRGMIPPPLPPSLKAEVDNPEGSAE